jgi:hypothetical protein
VLEQNGWATIRQLPDGDPVPGHIQSRREQTLFVLLPPGVDAAFQAGTLLEVQSDLFLYLGVVIGWQDSVMLVTIEHAMDRTALAEVQSVWQGAREP